MRGPTTEIALQLAVEKEYQSGAQLLLEKGAAISIRGTDYLEILQAATYNSQYNLVLLLTETGINIDIQIDELGSALQLGYIKGHIDIVKLLLRLGINPNQVDEYGWTLLLCPHGFNRMQF